MIDYVPFSTNPATASVAVEAGQQVVVQLWDPTQSLNLSWISNLGTAGEQTGGTTTVLALEPADYEITILEGGSGQILVQSITTPS